MTRGTLFLAACIAIGLVFLCGLGFWQLDRMVWKEGLIARVEANLKGDPVSVADAIEKASQHDDGFDYIPVKITGEFEALAPVFEFTTFKGASGWNIYSLFHISPDEASELGKYAVINRGFIPYREREKFEGGVPPVGTIDIIGLLRSPPKNQPSAAFDNEPAKGTFYWRDIAAMADVFGKKAETSNAWYVDLGLPGETTASQTYPVGGTTLINFPNNHFQYALTWFGLGGTLLLVGGSFLWSRRNKNAA